MRWIGSDARDGKTLRSQNLKPLHQFHSLPKNQEPIESILFCKSAPFPIFCRGFEAPPSSSKPQQVYSSLDETTHVLKVSWWLKSSTISDLLWGSQEICQRLFGERHGTLALGGLALARCFRAEGQGLKYRQIRRNGRCEIESSWKTR